MNQEQWHAFLESKGAVWQGDAAEFTPSGDGLALVDLSPQGAIRVAGPDSQKFLQGQVTCDLVNLPPEHWTLGAHCNPKGRMISAFRALKHSEETLILWMPRDLAETARAALAKYAVFFKTELENISDSHRWLGLQGHHALTLSAELLGIPTMAPGAMHNFEWQGAHLIAVALNTHQVALLVPNSASAAAWDHLAESAHPGGYNSWSGALIQEGMPQIFAATSEQFIPQMTNLHVLGGVSFKKGCYTGQEVVARMQFRGASKRRMYRASIDGGSPPPAGATIFAGGDQGVGNVVESSSNNGGIELLAVLTNSKVAEGATFHLEDARELALQELPYDADADPLA